MTEIKHDDEYNILSVYLKGLESYKGRYHHSIDEGFHCILDVDEDDNLLGIEIILPKEVKYNVAIE